MKFGVVMRTDVPLNSIADLAREAESSGLEGEPPARIVRKPVQLFNRMLRRGPPGGWKMQRLHLTRLEVWKGCVFGSSRVRRIVNSGAT